MSDVNLDFQINNIIILSTELASSNKKFDSTTLSFNINLEHRFVVDKEEMKIDCSVNIFGEDKETLLGSITVRNVFFVKNIVQFVDKKSENITLPDMFIHTINSISIANTRGVMFASFKGTYLHSAILPLVDPKGFKK